MLDIILFWFVWIALAFLAGVITHWRMTRKQRCLLKLYQQQAHELRQWVRPTELSNCYSALIEGFS